MSVQVAGRRLPVDVSGSRSPGWWGMVLLIVTEATLFAALISSYFYLQSGAPEWPPAGIEPPELLLAGIGTVILLSSSAPMVWAELAIGKGHTGRLRLGMALSFILGAIFIVIQAIEYSRKGFSPQTNAYGSLFFTITGFHGVHVLIGLAMGAVIQVRARLGHFDAERHLAVQNVALYWHFVDGVWIVVFTSLYLSPRFL